MATVAQSPGELFYPGRKLPPARRLTEEEFLAWCDEDTRAEWIEGDVVLMSPANVEHVLLSGFTYEVLSTFVRRRRLGKAFQTDLMVRVKGGRLGIPDLSFVTTDRLSLLTEKLCDGAPDLIVEVVSPDSIDRDWHDKFAEYAAAGVAEYWIVDPLQDCLAAFTLADGGRYVAITENEGKIASVVVPGFYLRTTWLFGDELPDVDDVLREMGSEPRA
jgi:Uma2 family endonuclease